MKEILLDNFLPMFAVRDTFPIEYLFKPYATAEEIEGSLYRKIIWRCQTCGQIATQAPCGCQETPEIILSCSCRTNYTYGLDTAKDMATAAEAIPLSNFQE